MFPFVRGNFFGFFTLCMGFFCFSICEPILKAEQKLDLGLCDEFKSSEDHMSFSDERLRTVVPFPFYSYCILGLSRMLINDGKSEHIERLLPKNLIKALAIVKKERGFDAYESISCLDQFSLMLNKEKLGVLLKSAGSSYLETLLNLLFKAYERDRETGRSAKYESQDENFSSIIYNVFDLQADAPSLLIPLDFTPKPRDFVEAQFLPIWLATYRFDKRHCFSTTIGCIWHDWSDHAASSTLDEDSSFYKIVENLSNHIEDRDFKRLLKWLRYLQMYRKSALGKISESKYADNIYNFLFLIHHEAIEDELTDFETKLPCFEKAEDKPPLDFQLIASYLSQKDCDLEKLKTSLLAQDEVAFKKRSLVGALKFFRKSFQAFIPFVTSVEFPDD